MKNHSLSKLKKLNKNFLSSGLLDLSLILIYCSLARYDWNKYTKLCTFKGLLEIFTKRINTYKYSRCSQSQCFEDICSAPNPSIKKNRNSALCSFNDLYDRLGNYQFQTVKYKQAHHQTRNNKLETLWEGSEDIKVMQILNH